MLSSGVLQASPRELGAPWFRLGPSLGTAPLFLSSGIWLCSI